MQEKDKFLSDIQKEAEIHRLSPTEEMRLWLRIEDSKARYLRNRKRRLWQWTGIAAAITIIVAFFLYPFTISEDSEKMDYPSMLAQHESGESHTDITLILSKDRKITLRGKEAKVDYEEGYVNYTTGDGDMKQKEEVREKVHQLIVPKGKRAFIAYADGTKMWVNAGTSVVYPAMFAKSKREIYVQGEVFLDVAKDKKKTFIVKSEKMDIEVLGTQFNVSAYKEDMAHSVLLVEGKVEVGLAGKARQTLCPNQQLNFENGALEVREVKNFFAIAWVHGYYQYKDQPLNVILRDLAKYYGQEIVYGNNLNTFICSGKLDLKKDLRDVLTTLADANPIVVGYHESEISINVKP